MNMFNRYSNFDFERDLREDSFLTNFDKREICLYLMAIAAYRISGGKADLSIHKEAYSLSGVRLDFCYSLHVSERVDLSSFLTIFWRIKKEAEDFVKEGIVTR